MVNKPEMNGGSFMFKRLLCGLAAIVLLASAAGCRQEAVGDPLENKADGQNLEHSASSGNEGYRRTVLYYATDDGFVVPVMKMIPWEEGIGKAALGYLMDTDANRASAALMGLKTVIPEGTELSLRIDSEGEATLDFSGFTPHASVEEERTMVTAVVNTLAEFSSIDSVRITLDGQKVSTLPNGTNVKQAMTPFALNTEDGEISAGTEGATALTLYFPNRSASLNVPVTRYTEEGSGIETAMRALIKGPENAALRCCFPEGTELISADLFDGVATVNVSAEFLSAQYTEGLDAAAYTTMYLTANALEPIYELDILVEGEPYEFSAAVSAPLYVNEFASLGG